MKLGYCPCLFALLQRKWTPLYGAAWNGHMDVVQYLAEEKSCDPAVVTAVS